MAVNEEPSIIEELNAALYGSPTLGGERLTPEHLSRRDWALVRIEAAVEAVEKLEQIERGPTQGSQSPRHHAVRTLVAELSAIHTRLDNLYL